MKWLERRLVRFDNEDREFVLRLRLWKAQWFPHRTAEILGWTDGTGDGSGPQMIIGPWKWHRPKRWQGSS